MSDLREHLKKRILEIVGADREDLVQLQPPKQRSHGDITLACFMLAKQQRSSPADIAARIADALAADEMIEAAVAAGPFVNVRFQRAELARTAIEAILHQNAPFGQMSPTGRVVVIDFSSPNIAKPFHIGHMRSTVIGAALRRIHQHLGTEVHGINHLGDWGMPFAKMMTAYMRWGDQEKLDAQPMRYMFSLYLRYGNEAKDDPSLDEEAAKHFKNLESGADNQERALWKFLRDESLKAFQGPYDRLGVSFDHITGESFYQDKMAGAMQKVIDAGVLTQSEGAEIVDLRDQGIKVPCILRKSDGTTLYHTRDLAAAFYRQETYHPDRILYVVGSEQKLHFQQLKAMLTKMGSDLAETIEHVPFGLILAKNPENDKWEKFASRAGNAIFLDEVLDEAVANARRIIEKKNPDLHDKEHIAEQIGVSAIIFNDLKNSRIKDVKFDWDTMLSFEGETGPYVQYACARLSSILRKADAQDDVDTLLHGIDYRLLADAEDVLLSMHEFGPSLQRAATQSEPSVITNLMIQVAGEIHSYLHEHHVLRADQGTKRARLALVAAARRLLKTGLGLIGVAAPDEM